ncbi:hypothetical protein Q3G72_010150 [Acer saccharum]|nr:hypothetical protein Q3G72_010150 [Acer saccharum]
MMRLTASIGLVRPVYFSGVNMVLWWIFLLLWLAGDTPNWRDLSLLLPRLARDNVSVCPVAPVKRSSLSFPFLAWRPSTSLLLEKCGFPHREWSS